MAERIMTISLRKYLSTQPRNKRARKALKYVRERVAHYTKTDLDKVKINEKLNSIIVKTYSKRMLPVKLLVSVDKGVAHASAFSLQKKEVKEKPKESEGKAVQSNKDNTPQEKENKDSGKKEMASPSK